MEVTTSVKIDLPDLDNRIKALTPPSETASIEELKTLCLEQQKLLTELAGQFANYNETIEYLVRKLYGRSKETTQIEGQLNFFNEVEEALDLSKEEPSLEEALGEISAVAGNKKKKRKKKATREEILGCIETKRVDVNVPDDERTCEWCGNEMKTLGYSYAREELHVVPMQLTRIQYYQEKLICEHCKSDDAPVFAEAQVPEPLLNHGNSLASPSSVAYIMYMKYVNHMPLYRLETLFFNQGVRITRATFANWVNTCATEYLQLIFDRLKELLLQREVLHGDETTCQVLKEPGKPATSKSYMWLVVTGNDGLPFIAWYEYRDTRSHTVPEELYKDFNGYLHTDCYSGYNILEDHVTRCSCWAHVRRKWFEAIPDNLKKDREPKLKLTPAEIGFHFCNMLFEEERKLKDTPYEEKKELRLQIEKPMLQKFFAWLETLTPLGGSKLEKAIGYALNNRTNLMNYLKDGRCEISNNAAENSARPYTLGRKNFLFHDTVNGAKSSAMIYSIVQTAKYNGLDEYKYLYQLLLRLPGYKKEPAGIDELLPWSDLMQRLCHVPIPPSEESPTTLSE